MSAYRIAATAYLLAFLLLPAAWVLGQAKGKTPIRRAQPPVFTKADPFFEDAFGSLSGQRPANLGQAAAPNLTAGATSPSPSTASDAGGSPGAGWSTWISGAALEDEIKAQKLQAEKNITTPSDFNGNGYKNARRDFSMVALIFAIIGEYDGDVRWKKEAPSQRDAFARTAANAKVGTTGVYNEAKLRKQDLSDLIGGQTVETKEAEAAPKWGEVVSRSPLMQRLELNTDAKIKAWTSSGDAFEENLEALQHEAQIFTVIGEVLKKEGLEDSDDEEYRKLADLLVGASRDLTKACKEKNFEAASKAASAITVSCDKCHESYR
jgi:hypothetical protein